MDLMDGGILSYLTHGNADHRPDASRFIEEAGDATSAGAFRAQRWLAGDLDRLERAFATAAL